MFWMFYTPMWCVISGLTRLYYSSTSGIYKVVLNQVLPWQKKLVVPFRPSEIAQVDTDKSGWKVGGINAEFSYKFFLLIKVTGITKFELIPVQRTLWLDKDSFHKPKDYWTLCGKEIRDWDGQKDVGQQGRASASSAFDCKKWDGGNFMNLVSPYCSTF